MYYSSLQIVFQEVPNEISLSFSISGCQLKCKGCHSAFTWNVKYGKELTESDFVKYLEKYEDSITCVLFYGGEWESENLIKYLKIAISKNFKTCLYTGLNLEELEWKILKYLSYLKVGRYIQSLGGLGSKLTNQKFYKLANGKIIDELTNRFN